MSSRSVGSFLSAVHASTVQTLDGIAGKLKPSSAPPPIGNLLLDDRLFGLIEPTISRVGLVLTKVGEGSGAQFYRLPTRLGLAGLIRLPGEVLADGEQALQVGLIARELRCCVSVLFVLTDGKTIAGTYKFSLWPSWKKANYFKEVRSFDAEFLAFLESQPPEVRLDTLADNFELDLLPPHTVAMEQVDLDSLIDVLLERALEPVGTPNKILGDLVASLHVDNRARGQIANRLDGGDVNVVCREVVQWASAVAYPEGHPRYRCYTVVGTLLESLSAVSGLEQRKKLAAIAESYGLIRDRDLLARLRDQGAVQ